jgi:hypothetical protein
MCLSTLSSWLDSLQITPHVFYTILKNLSSKHIKEVYNICTNFDTKTWIIKHGLHCYGLSFYECTQESFCN